MLINNIDITEYNATLLDRRISTDNVITNTQWGIQSNHGELINQFKDFRQIYLQFLIINPNEQIAYNNINKLIEQIKTSVLVFDDLDYEFRCYLNHSTTPERIDNGVFKLNLILMNDIAKGPEINLSFNITPINAHKVQINYYTSRAELLRHYLKAFDNDDIYQKVGSDTIYYTEDILKEKAQSSYNWDDFFLSLGVNLNKYKPQARNTDNGFVYTKMTYTTANAIKFITNNNIFNVYYNYFHKDGFYDLPDNVLFPSLSLRADLNNNQYYALPAGAGYNLSNLSIEVNARLFNNGLNNETNVNSGILGTSDQNDYFSYFINKIGNDWNLVSYLGNLSKKYTYTSNNSGVNRPQGKSGFIQSPYTNTWNLYYQGEVLKYNIEKTDKVLNNNLLLFKAYQPTVAGSVTGKELEISNCILKYNGEEVLHLIPISGGVKNGFVNEEDCGFYDINKMLYIPKSDSFNENTIKEIYTRPEITVERPIRVE